MIRRASVLEATARKPGNVHPAAAFEDLCYGDFVRAAAAAAPALARAGEVGVGRAVLEAVARTRVEARTNVNLGIALLVAPLAAVPLDRSLVEGTEEVLAGLTRDDAAFVYEAIRLARPGGLGEVALEDVSGEPARPLREIMSLAADRDEIAAEYAEGFPLVLGLGLPFLSEGRAAGSWGRLFSLPTIPGGSPHGPRSASLPGRPGGPPHVLIDLEPWEEAVIGLHLRLMSARPDTLIARKCGPEVARESAARAARVLEAGWPASAEGREEFARLDAWLRADGHRRNPGTTADLVAGTLFAALREWTFGR
ncbi:MAG: triphosphoribosyl-dephospho-CoA synthase [Planctomycetales bacterium]